MEPVDQFQKEISDRIASYSENLELQATAKQFFDEIGCGKGKYVYNFYWLGVPIIQLPQDLQAFQEIIWEVKPDLIIETGIAWGGSILFSASMLCILEACQLIENSHVIGVDLEVRSHNKKALSKHPLHHKYTLFEGSSTSPQIVETISNISKNYKRVLVCLDSNHTHEHVLQELEAYAPLVTIDSYCIVEDTTIETSGSQHTQNRIWGMGNSPLSAIYEYQRILKTEGRLGLDGNPIRFINNELLEKKLIITGSPGGFLKRVK